MKFTTRFEGGAALAEALRQLPARVSRSVLRDALRETVAAPIQRAAAANAPRGPGQPDIANHIVVSNGRSENEFAAAIVVGPSRETRSDQPAKRFDQQGVYLEFGTKKTPMQAFMRPAFDSEAVRTLGPLGAALWRELAGRGFNRPTEDAPSAPSGPGGGGLI